MTFPFWSTSLITLGPVWTRGTTTGLQQFILCMYKIKNVCLSFNTQSCMPLACHLQLNTVVYSFSVRLPGMLYPPDVTLLLMTSVFLSAGLLVRNSPSKHWVTYTETPLWGMSDVGGRDPLLSLGSAAVTPLLWQHCVAWFEQQMVEMVYDSAQPNYVTDGHCSNGNARNELKIYKKPA